MVAHEIGHVIGLGHSADVESLMYYSIGPKEHLSLSLDDQNGVSFLYPRNELRNLELFGGCGRIQDSRSDSFPSDPFSKWWNGNSLLFFSTLYFLGILLRRIKRVLFFLNKSLSSRERPMDHA